MRIAVARWRCTFSPASSRPSARRAARKTTWSSTPPASRSPEPRSAFAPCQRQANRGRHSRCSIRTLYALRRVQQHHRKPAIHHWLDHLGRHQADPRRRPGFRERAGNRRLRSGPSPYAEHPRHAHGDAFITNEGSVADENNTSGSPQGTVYACNVLTFPSGSCSGNDTVHYWIWRSIGAGSFSLIGVAQGLDPGTRIAPQLLRPSPRICPALHQARRNPAKSPPRSRPAAAQH
jgi:hypothetical protein